MIKSARLPDSREPTRPSHLTIDAGLRVAIETSSQSVKPNPPTSFTVLATFSSLSRFLLPVSDQSEPRAIGTLADFAATILVVSPYSNRLLSGDHTIEPPC